MEKQIKRVTNLYGLICLGFSVLNLTLAANAQSPNAINGKPVQCTVTTGTTPFASSGLFRFIPSSVDNGFGVVPLSGSVTSSSGTFSYFKTGENTATLDFNDSHAGVGSTALSFSTETTGTFVTTSASFPGSSQSGTFVIGAAIKTATVSATARSVVIDPIFWESPGIGTVGTFFSTYDGTTNTLFNVVSGYAIFSDELQRDPANLNRFRADYLNSNSSLGFDYAHGVGTFTLPAINDSDANTLPDIFQFDKAATIDYTGNLQSQKPSVNTYTTSGRLTKQAGSISILYSMVVKDAAGAILQDSGGTTLNASLLFFRGSLNYSRTGGANQLELVLTQVIPDSQPVTYTASTPFTVTSANQISVPAVAAKSSGGAVIQVSAFSLTRQGSKYSGDIQVSDGRLDTSWADYKTWRVEMTDTNDADANGIPDFSDALTGLLQVTIAPAGAVAAGAQWRVDAGTFRNSGTTLSGLSPGNHTVSFKTVTGWVTPANQTITVNAQQTTTVNATYVPQTGSIQVTIGPAAAISAGAQWQVDGGVYMNSGATVSGLSLGNHSVSFKSVQGWVSPANRSILVSANQTTNVSVVYVAEIGSLQVTITPAGAISAGAQWRVGGGTFRNSGTVASGLTVGNHTVSYKSVVGWATPPDQIVTVNANVTTSVSTAYAIPSGSLQVTITPTAAASVGAQWQVDGGAFMNSGATISGLSPGSHTISFKPLAGWGTPLSQQVTLAAGQNTSATGLYGIAPSVQIVQSPNGNISVRFATQSGFQYRLQGASSISSPTVWGDVQVLLGNGTEAETVIGSISAPVLETVPRYFRVKTD